MTGKQRLSEISKAYKAGQVAKTRELCEVFLRDFPNHGRTWYQLACSLIDLHLYAEAEAALARGEECDKEDKHRQAHIHSMRGMLWAEKGDFVRAEECYWKAHFLCPRRSWFLVECGEMASARGELERALELLTRACNCPEGDLGEAHCYRAKVLLAMRRYGEAADAYRAALSISPLNKRYRNGLAEVEELLG